LPDRCPDCGGTLSETHVAQQFQVEISRKPIHRQFNIHVGRCSQCHRRVQGRHALQTSDALGAAVARGRLESQLSDLIFPPKANAANERLAQHLWAHRDDLFTFLRQPGLDATNWRAELAIRFGVILRKVWGGSRTWAGARAQSVLMSVWRTCWQQGRSALDFLSHLLRGSPVALTLPP
jgi:hypothetical protein